MSALASLRIGVEWRPRGEPLEPLAVAATGNASYALAQRWLATEGAQALRGVSGDRVIVLLGPRDALPWVDGVVYLGRDPEAPSLLLPVTHAPSVPAALLERAVVRHVGEWKAPIAFFGDPPMAASVAAAREVSRARLDTWLAGRR